MGGVDADYYRPGYYAPFRCDECGEWVNGSQAWFWSQVAQAAILAEVMRVLPLGPFPAALIPATGSGDRESEE